MWKNLLDTNGNGVMINFDKVSHFQRLTDTTTRIHVGSEVIIVDHAFDALKEWMMDQQGNNLLPA
jgi:hypothetical protein